MKILLICSSVKGSLGESYLRSFLELNEKAEIIDDEKLYKESIFLAKNKYCHHLFWRFLANFFQKKLIEKIVSEKPDLIFIFKGWLIKPKTLLKIKKGLSGARLFNFNTDNPFNTWHHGNSNSWIRKSIPLYDAYFIWGKFLLKPLKKAGAKRTEYLPCGYDLKLHYPVEVTDAEKKIFGSDIAFIGSWDKEREWWLNKLLMTDDLMTDDLKIWGNAWQKANKKLREKWQGRAVIGEEFSKVCNASKIILNFVRKQNGSAHNMRTFEVPACQGFILSTRTEEAVGFFEEGKEADYFSTLEELKQKIDFYLRNEESRKKIAEAGYKKLLGADYSYKDRAKRVLEIYKLLG